MKFTTSPARPRLVDSQLVLRFPGEAAHSGGGSATRDRSRRHLSVVKVPKGA